ncbi:eukaryotic translation initiation factor 5B-like, partial [Harmonia axyridis]|uniref:eukaryotic translation initiation factor 5B-like n=1 Tax=Harmonia axyridis TaxID=115357 RepID=UPI001E277E65
YIPQEDISEGTKRVTRSKVDRTSDVILENPVVPVIDLSDSVDKIEELPTRSTRTRTKKKAESASVENTKTKNASDTKEDTELSEPPVRTTRTKRKRSKSNSTTDEPLHKDESCIGAGNETITNISAHTEYEDTVSQFENRPNATFIVSMEGDSNEEQIKLGGHMNETVVIDPSKNQEIAMSNTNDLITDDESIEEQETAIVKQQKIKKDNSYENSPVKKKVEVFENLQKNKNITTSKLNASNILRELEGNKGNVKEKAKGFFAQNSIGVTKTNPPSASELRQAMNEERKKKYEEKVKRVLQHQKETMEKEKEKVLELQRIKEERYKMVLQQKEEKQRLLKEENERKRQLAKQRAEEKRKEEEALRIAAQEKKEQKRKIEGDIPKKFGKMIPIYMHQPTPPLPCYDCYDSDDERYTERKNIPVWASKTNVRKWDYIQMGIGHKIKNTMFCCHSQNVDLKEVFQRIDPKNLSVL